MVVIVWAYCVVLGQIIIQFFLSIEILSNLHASYSTK